MRLARQGAIQLGQGVIDFPAPGVADPTRNVAHAVDYVKAWRGRHERITPAIFCHSPYTCGSQTLKAAKKAARELGVPLLIHLAETRGEEPGAGRPSRGSRHDAGVGPGPGRSGE